MGLTSILYRKVSRIIGVKEDVLEREALRQYILSELRRVRIEARLIMARYGVSSIEELDEKIRCGELEETKVFEDFTRLDYLLDRASRTLNFDKRSSFWKRAQRIIIEDRVIIPVYFEVSPAAANPKVHDWDASGGFVRLVTPDYSAWIEQ